MSSELGKHYRPSEDEQQVFKAVAAVHAGAEPTAIRPALAEAWMHRFSRGANGEVNDWFDYATGLIANLPKP